MHEPVVETFSGVMQITPKAAGVAPFVLEGDWRLIEDPEYPGRFYWLGCGRSFGADICQPLEGQEDGDV